MPRSIHVYDEFKPEDVAMLQALYSRSASSVTNHVERVHQTGSGKFMETYYIGYSHKSIGDCGTTTIFFEEISELAAKAIQDWPLYSGQQTSTRYIDFATQPLFDPLESQESKAILSAWMDFYTRSREPVLAHLEAVHPRQPDEEEKTYQQAIKARSFDILRSFLPAAVTTQLSWHTNLRQANDKLLQMRHHPLEEVRDIAAATYSKLAEHYPHSFTGKEYASQEAYVEHWMRQYAYLDNTANAGFSLETTMTNQDLEPYTECIASRPNGSELPPFLGELGQLHCNFILDYGSFRDIQRHRNGTTRMPILTPDLGFQEWYLEQLPAETAEQARALIQSQLKRIEKLKCSREIRQYYLAMGFNVAGRISCGLPSAVYITELRSGPTVHPTLRTVAHAMHHALKERFPDLVLHSDTSPDAFSYKRGSQTITAKQ